MKIMKDWIGLYTVCGGYISRPFFGTSFQEGDDVKTHHFGGSTLAGVTSVGKPLTHNFKKDGQYELWSTTGTSKTEYKNKTFKVGFENLFGSNYSTFEEYLELGTSWHEKHHPSEIYIDRNLKFVK